MTVQETQGYGSRLVSSIKGVLFGLVLFLISFPLLWWNEGRAVQTAKSLSEGAASVISVTKRDAVNEGKLVHVSGAASTTEMLADPQLGVNISALRLQRRVEMFQWEEKSSSRENSGGSKTTTYTYEKTWSDKVISSSRFKEAGHENPSQMKLASLDVPASHAKLVDFDLSPDIVKRLDKWEPLPPALTTSVVASKLPANLKAKTYAANGETLYLGDNPASPVVGDCRLGFRIVSSPLTMSIVAKQTGTGFKPMPMQAGDAILLTATQAKDAASMFTAAEVANEKLTWIMRAAGWFLMTFGVFLVLQPIAMFVNFVPLAGSFVSFGTFMLAAVGCTALSLMTIATAWIVYRPFLGIGILIVAAFGAVATVVMMRRASAKKKASFAFRG